MRSSKEKEDNPEFFTQEQVSKFQAEFDGLDKNEIFIKFYKEINPERNLAFEENYYSENFSEISERKRRKEQEKQKSKTKEEIQKEENEKKFEKMENYYKEKEETKEKQKANSNSSEYSHLDGYVPKDFFHVNETESSFSSKTSLEKKAAKIGRKKIFESDLEKKFSKRHLNLIRNIEQFEESQEKKKNIAQNLISNLISEIVETNSKKMEVLEKEAQERKSFSELTNEYDYNKQNNNKKVFINEIKSESNENETNKDETGKLK